MFDPSAGDNVVLTISMQAPPKSDLVKPSSQTQSPVLMSHLEFSLQLMFSHGSLQTHNTQHSSPLGWDFSMHWFWNQRISGWTENISTSVLPCCLIYPLLSDLLHSWLVCRWTHHWDIHIFVHSLNHSNVVHSHISSHSTDKKCLICMRHQCSECQKDMNIQDGDQQPENIFVSISSHSYQEWLYEVI